MQLLHLIPTFLLCAVVANAFRATLPKGNVIFRKLTSIRLSDTENSGSEDTSSPRIDAQVMSTTSPVETETPEQVERRKKLAQIEELKAQEVFVTRDTGRYECQACGYMYDESKGYPKRGIPEGTKFEDIEKFRCPECGANKKYFVAETETLSGFKENLKFGLGTNTLTGGQKANLIYGGLLIGFLIFMSGYLLE